MVLSFFALKVIVNPIRWRTRWSKYDKLPALELLIFYNTAYHKQRILIPSWNLLCVYREMWKRLFWYLI